MGNSPKESGDAPVLEPSQKIERPPLFRVLLHNDDYTSMDFVVEVLSVVFHKPAYESVEIMLKVHHDGIGIAGVYPQEIAETKLQTVGTMAKGNGFPLMCSMEPE